MILTKGSFFYFTNINVPFGSSGYPQMSPKKPTEIRIIQVKGNNFWGKLIQYTPEDKQEIVLFTGVKSSIGNLHISTTNYALDTNGNRIETLTLGKESIYILINELSNSFFEIISIKQPGMTIISKAKFYPKYEKKGCGCG